MNELGYVWLHPKAGGFSVYRFVHDYDKEKSDGFSIYEDFRDLDVPAPKIEVAEKPVPEVFSCAKCGKVSTTNAGAKAHQRFCKG